PDHLKSRIVHLIDRIFIETAVQLYPRQLDGLCDAQYIVDGLVFKHADGGNLVWDNASQLRGVFDRDTARRCFRENYAKMGRAGSDGRRDIDIAGQSADFNDHDAVPRRFRTAAAGSPARARCSPTKMASAPASRILK